MVRKFQLKISDYLFIGYLMYYKYICCLLVNDTTKIFEVGILKINTWKIH
jgi:hypothetical protein